MADEIIFARMGERMICTQGHTVARVLKAVTVADSMNPCDCTVVEWVPGVVKAQQCPCGGSISAMASFGNGDYRRVIRFPDGWRWIDAKTGRLVKSMELPQHTRMPDSFL